MIVMTRTRRRQYRAAVAEEIARAIENAVCEPGEDCVMRFCPDCTRYGQAQSDAATARRIGVAASTAGYCERDFQDQQRGAAP